MEPSSSAQLDARRHRTVPPLERVRDDVWAVPVPMPGHQRGLGYTFCYVIRDQTDGLHVVDPGWDTADNRVALRAALDTISGGSPVSSVVLTHLHPDHLGLAAHLRDVDGAPVVMHALEAEAIRSMGSFAPPPIDDWGVPADVAGELAQLVAAMPVEQPLLPDVVLDGAEATVDIDGVTATAIHTPGHTSGSICIRLPEHGLLLTGDHVLPEINPGLGLGGPTASNPIADYLTSLDRVSAFDDDEVLPGHEYRFRGLAARCAVLATHHRGRTGEVAAVLGSNAEASIWQVASALTWSGGWEQMRGFYLFSALSQTAQHVELVRAGSE